MEKKKRKIKYGNIIALIVVLLCIGAVIYSSFNIIKWYLANKENAKIKEELQESIVIEKIENPINEEEVIEKYQMNLSKVTHFGRCSIAPASIRMLFLVKKRL